MRRRIQEDSTYERFKKNEKGLVIRIAQVDGIEQTVTPRSLQERALFLAHTPLLAGHPGGSRMYQNLRRQVY